MSDQLELLSDGARGVPEVLGARPIMSAKRRAILGFLELHSVITLAEATTLVGTDIYHNAAKHTGAVLSAMVKHKLIKRLKPGVFSKP